MSDSFLQFVSSYFLIGLGAIFIFCEAFFSPRFLSYTAAARRTLGVVTLVVCCPAAYRMFDTLSAASSSQVFAFVGVVLGAIGGARLFVTTDSAHGAVK